MNLTELITKARELYTLLTSDASVFAKFRAFIAFVAFLAPLLDGGNFTDEGFESGREPANAEVALADLEACCASMQAEGVAAGGELVKKLLALLLKFLPLVL